MTGGFEFATAARIVFGRGKLPEAGPAAAALGRKALLVTGCGGEQVERLTKILAEHGVETARLPVCSEPDVPLVEEGLRLAREAGCDLVIGLGGGSALDACKAVAALLTNPGSPLDYLEVVGRGQVLRQPPAPYIAIPTTAGTGSEVSRNAVLTVPEQQVKVSLRSPMLAARLALVDPELTDSLPPEVTAATGMDALAQVIEPYVSARANPLTDLYCRDGIARAARSLRAASRNGQDTAARDDMAFASLMGGLALANAGLGAVHGFAGPLGGLFHAPHGAVCAALLPPVVAVNARALGQRAPGHPALDRYTEIAAWVTGQPDARIGDLVDWLVALRHDLHIPGLGQYGVSAGDLESLVEKSAAASSMKANPIVLTREEMREILEQAMVP